MTLSLAFLALLAAPTLQEPTSDPLAVPVLVQNGREWSAREVLTAAGRHDPTLLRTLEEDPEYRRLYLASPRFVDQVRHFSNLLAVEAAGVPEVDRTALLKEASLWAREHGSHLPPEGVLAAHGLEVEWRARLLAEQPESFPTAELRRHMLRSVPEFFGQLEISWIRLPLVDPATGFALTQEARRALYERLDEAARKVQAGALTWKEAVEEYATEEADRRDAGRVGLVSRTEVSRFEEPFLRELFRDLGYKRPPGPVLRGPILGQRWIYLVRIESVLIRGVVDLEQVRARVARSLREELLRRRLAELTRDVERRILAPVVP